MIAKKDGTAKKIFSALTLIVIYSINGFTQSPFRGKEHLFTMPHSYTVFYTRDAMVMDGDATEPSWKLAPWSAYFMDIEGDRKPAPVYQTRFKMLWDNQQLYIYAELEEPHLWGTLTQHDEIVYHNNDFEIFIDPDGDTHQYYEIEVNVLKTIFDLYMDKPYRNGGIARIKWNAEGLKTGVRLNGTLNKPDDLDKSWTVEMAIPFTALSLENPTPTPQNNTVWRMNFSRVHWNLDVNGNQYQRKKDINNKLLPENNWVWSQQGVINMHFPERWGYILFTTQTSEPVMKEFVIPITEYVKQYLWLAYYKQKDYFAAHKQYAEDLKALGFSSDKIKIQNQSCKIGLKADEKEFTVRIQCKRQSERLSITGEGLITRTE